MELFRNKYKLLGTLILALFISLISNAQQKGTVNIQSGAKINAVIAKKRAYNKEKEIKGFKIQIFNGSEQGAYITRDKFSTLFPDDDIKIQFSSPEWKVQVGNYLTRLEADRELLKIKDDFPNAIVLPSVIELNN
ncbi:MAG: SPOR domain-containing protein [Flavobacteriaceae bacterium]|nr:SPOR domain-containing protein [Flavobacteriaceae bacterium]